MSIWQKIQFFQFLSKRGKDDHFNDDHKASNAQNRPCYQEGYYFCQGHSIGHFYASRAPPDQELQDLGVVIQGAGEPGVFQEQEARPLWEREHVVQRGLQVALQVVQHVLAV